MFTTPAPAAPSVTATTVSPVSPTPTRPSRLRGLSYLRNYTHSLHSHVSSTAGGSSRADARIPRDSQPETVAATPSTSGLRARAASTTPPIAPSSERLTPHRTHTAPGSVSVQTHANVHSLSTSTPMMTRNRAETATPGLTVRNQSGPTPAVTPPVASMDSNEGPSDTVSMNKHLPSIRFIPHQDPRAGRPSLQFPTITRTLPDENSVIRVGRYSERDNIPEIPPNVPSAAAVGFKSKVVSRKHCELWCTNSQWYIKDVKSSSGTFLNHIRLSQPNAESKPFKIKDGDIIQLGIDFRGGEEMIFRCVKIRVECNRGWQQALNTFNKQTHQRLRNLAKNKKDSDSASTHSSECSICLMSIAPCQSLFVAPCSHVWHYKCIRPILNGPTWPNFLCPNCRAVADLEADVEDPGEFEEWESAEAVADSEKETSSQEDREDKHITPRASQMPLINAPEASGSQNAGLSLSDLEVALSNINIGDSVNGVSNQPATPQRTAGTPASSSVTQPVAINISHTNEDAGFAPLFQQASDGLSPDRQPDCPMTPRNDAGPFVLDGSAGRGSASRRDESSNSGAPTLPPLHMN